MFSGIAALPVFSGVTPLFEFILANWKLQLLDTSLTSKIGLHPNDIYRLLAI